MTVSVEGVPTGTHGSLQTDDYEDHPLAEAFPLLGKDELRDLMVDIRTHGLREPITLFENKILDGRNRKRACKWAEVEPKFETYTGDDPVGFVISKNL